MTGAGQIHHPCLAARAGEAAALQQAIGPHKSHSCGPISCPLWEAHPHLYHKHPQRLVVVVIVTGVK